MAIIAREKREAARRAAARRAREKARRKKAAVNPLQALWDANGAAIYAANQAFKTKYGKNMSAKVRRKAIKDATRNGHFNAGAYAGNLVKAATPPPPKKEDPYVGIGDWVERQDKSNAKMLDGVSELEKWAALQKQKNAPVDSATASYMAMGAAVEAGKFSKDDYDKARKQAENNALNRGLRAYYEGRKAGEGEYLENRRKSAEVNQVGSNLYTNILDEGGGFAIDYATEFKLWKLEFRGVADGPMAGKISLPGPLDDPAREVFDLPGTGAHNVATIQDAVDDVLIEDAAKIIDDGGADSFLGKYGGPLLTGGIILYTNAAHAFNDDTLSKGDQWQHFGVGTSADLALDWLTGIGAAAFASWAVPAVIGVLAGAGFVVTAPAWAPFALAAIVAAGVGFAFDQFGWSDAIKNNINDFVDDIQGE